MLTGLRYARGTFGSGLSFSRERRLYRKKQPEDRSVDRCASRTGRGRTGRTLALGERISNTNWASHRRCKSGVRPVSYWPAWQAWVHRMVACRSSATGLTGSRAAQARQAGQTSGFAADAPTQSVEQPTPLPPLPRQSTMMPGAGAV